jgi:dTDP-4-dehydrorhamnose 3,5-epimerase
MNFIETALAGAYIIDIEKREDNRGFFARAWCADEFAQHRLDIQQSQFSISFNHKRGTLRGMHWQAAPHGEVKLVRCTGGAIYDVIVDLRPTSPTFKQWIGVELSAANRRMLYIPKSFAHGFITLADATEVFYQISVSFNPQAGRGARYDDPAFGIMWPEPVAVISDKDLQWPTFVEATS